MNGISRTYCYRNHSQCPVLQYTSETLFCPVLNIKLQILRNPGGKKVSRSVEKWEWVGRKNDTILRLAISHSVTGREQWKVGLSPTITEQRGYSLTRPLFVPGTRFLKKTWSKGSCSPLRNMCIFYLCVWRNKMTTGNDVCVQGVASECI